MFAGQRGRPPLAKVLETVDLYHPTLDRTITVPAGTEAGLVAPQPLGGGWEYARKKKAKKAEDK